jgi:signal peptidase I
VLLLALTRVAVVETVTVTSGSMLPTLEPGDRLVVSKTTRIEAGDIVVLDGTRLIGPTDTRQSGAGAALARLVGADPATAYVKRVIGVPGDRVLCCTPDGRLVRNGQALDEPYARGPSDTVDFDVTVPAERFWVLGDNRPQSADSRSALGRPGGGMLRADDIIGEAVWRYWPRDRWGAIREDGRTPVASRRTGARPRGEIGNTAEEILAHPQSKESQP